MKIWERFINPVYFPIFMAKDDALPKEEHTGASYRRIQDTIVLPSQDKDVYLGVHFTAPFTDKAALDKAAERLKKTYREQRGQPVGFRQVSGSSELSDIERLIEELFCQRLDVSLRHAILYTEMSGDESLGDVLVTAYPSGHILVRRTRPSAERDILCRFTLARGLYAADESLIAGALGEKK